MCLLDKYLLNMNIIIDNFVLTFSRELFLYSLHDARIEKWKGKWYFDYEYFKSETEYIFS